VVCQKAEPPQHAGVPSARKAQALLNEASSALNPLSEGASSMPFKSNPQQSIAPLSVNPQLKLIPEANA
jgi:hypothetical protein